MPFPQTPLPVLVDIAPGAQPAADPDDWDYLDLWADITDDVRVAQEIRIEQGRPDEADTVDPSTCVMTVDNRTGDYTPHNALGQWYGSLRKNTPARVRLRRLLDTFTRTVAAGSWGTSDTGITWSGSGPEYSVTGGQGVVTLTAGASVSTTMTNAGAWDFDFVGTVSIDAMPVGGNWQNRVNFRRTGTTNTYIALLEFTTTGAINVFLYRTLNGVQTVVSSAVSGVTFTAGQKIKVRVKADGGFVGIKVWQAASSQPSGWQTSSAAEGRYGLDNTGLGTNIQVQAFRTATNTATTSAAWDQIEVTAPLIQANVVSWPTRWDQSGNDCTAPVEAAGVLRRLMQGKSPLASPMFQTIYGETPKPVAYWPLEDDSGSTSAVGIGAGVKPASVYEAAFGTNSGTDPQLQGASNTLQITQNTTVSGAIPSTPLPDNSWLWVMAIYTPAWPAGTTIAVPVRLRSAGTATTWQIQFTNQLGGQIYAIAFDPDSNVLANISVAARNFTPGAWHIVQLESWQNGGNVSNLLRTWNLTTNEHVATGTTSYVGSVGQPKSWSLFGSSTTFPNGSVGHMAFFNRRSVFTIDQLFAAGQGYTGETAADRIVRLCAEQDVSVDVVDTVTGSALMGRQTAASFLDLVQEAADTDYGILSEFSGGLRYRTRDRRYNLTSTLTLDFAAGHIAKPPQPTDDDQRVRNDWTVTRKDGTSARIADEDHVAEHGRYEGSAEINPNDDDSVFNQAGWRLFLGTRDELRWPSITLDLARNLSLIERVLALQVGSVIQIDNPPIKLSTGTLRLVVEGWEHNLHPFGWDVILACSSHEPWRQPLLGDADLLVDSSVSALNAGVSASATSLQVVRPTGTPAWSTAPGSYDIDVFGEAMTVTAVTGTGTVQTFTVTRGVNGIAKAHNAGEPVRLRYGAVVAL